MAFPYRFTGFVLVYCLSVNLLAQLDTIQIPGSEVEFTLAKIPAGAFQMGDENGSANVQLSAFWIMTHEVTHDAYRLFQRRDNDTPSAVAKDFDVDAITRPTPPYLDLTYGMGTRGGFPQVNTTQQAALRYCKWLYLKTGQFFRLPTEAEWEYACLASSNVDVNPDLLHKAWLYENAEERFHPVGEKEPNAWGLYDMLGNVSEWTLDQYTADYFELISNQQLDPWISPSSKHSRTIRGGSFDDYAEDCNCRVRTKSSPRWQARDPQIPKSKWWNVDAPFLGFRLVRPVKAPTPEFIAAFFAEAIVD
ncbi:MAG: SUMF1/EgtB/PvdO family nonheme iron enzyme [Bacteroidota bacterium]